MVVGTDNKKSVGIVCLASASKENYLSKPCQLKKEQTGLKTVGDPPDRSDGTEYDCFLLLCCHVIRKTKESSFHPIGTEIILW